MLDESAATASPARTAWSAAIGDVEPIQARRAGFSDSAVKEILEDGSNRARSRAEQTMQEVRAAMRMSPAAS